MKRDQRRFWCDQAELMTRSVGKSTSPCWETKCACMLGIGGMFSKCCYFTGWTKRKCDLMSPRRVWNKSLLKCLSANNYQRWLDAAACTLTDTSTTTPAVTKPGTNKKSRTAGSKNWSAAIFRVENCVCMYVYVWLCVCVCVCVCVCKIWKMRWPNLLQCSL